MADLKEAGWSQRWALTTVGVSRSAWHYHGVGRCGVDCPLPQADRDYPRRLSEAERARIMELTASAWGKGDSVMEAYAAAWDQGEYLASPRSWYRIANVVDQDLRPERPTTRRRGRRVAPRVEADRPGQVWMWDISDLKGPYVGIAYKAYCVQDLYSRKIVAHTVAEREDENIAAAMFETAFGAEGVPGHVHADNGAAMRSKALAGVCAKVGVTMSFNRPSVSNDNAFKEAEFRTMKYRPSYPGAFESLEEARAWVDQYVQWFNTEHHHCALGWHTPTTVEDGSWRVRNQKRGKVLAAHYKQHPDRYRKKPKVSRPAKTVGINLHRKQETTQK